MQPTYTISDEQLAANRANSALSTGPVTATGKAASAANSISHGLTAKQSVLPGESQQEYDHFIAEHIRLFSSLGNPQGVELSAQLADLRWRIRRVPAFEVKVLDFEIQSLLTNPEFAGQIEGLTRNQIEGLAYIRLVERKVLPNLHAQEARLNRRIDKTFQQLMSAGSSHSAEPAVEPPATENRKNEAISPPARPVPTTRQSPKTGRNEPCPCGSHLKYKRCCGNPLGTTATAAA